MLLPITTYLNEDFHSIIVNRKQQGEGQVHKYNERLHIFGQKISGEVKAINRNFNNEFQSISWKGWLIIISLFIIVLFPRILNLGTWALSDETNWILRSNTFREGLVSGNYANTYQSVHPGVISMWISTIFYSIGVLILGNEFSNLDLLFYEKLGHVIFVTLLTILIYILLIKIFNKTVAILSTVFIAFDPFHLFTSRLIHQDALVGSFVMISLLAAYLYVRKGKTKGYLVLSGISFGMAALTKIPSFLLVPYFILLFAIYHTKFYSKKRRIDKTNLKKLLKDIMIWIICACIIFIALWPAMWVAPVETTSNLLSAPIKLTTASSVNATTGGIRGGEEDVIVFPFNYYFYRLPFLITPVVLFFAMITLMWGLVNLKRGKKWSSLVPILLMLVFALYFVTMMTFSPKKSTRYILVYNIIMDIMAGFGLYLCSHFLIAKLKSSGSRLRAIDKAGTIPKVMALLLVIVCLSAQALSSLPLCPYYSVYNSPIHKAIFGPQEEYIGGDGEGIVETARYFNEKVGAENLTVAVIGRWQHTFKLFFTGNTTSFENATSYNTDYLVFYRQQYLQGIEANLTSKYFEGMEPEYTIRIQGLTYVWVYPRSTIVLSSSDISVSNSNPTVGENVTISATVHNLMDEEETVITRFFDGDPDQGGTLIGENLTTAIAAQGGTVVSASWIATSGSHQMFVCVENKDPEMAPIGNDRAGITLDIV